MLIKAIENQIIRKAAPLAVRDLEKLDHYRDQALTRKVFDQ